MERTGKLKWGKLNTERSIIDLSSNLWLIFSFLVQELQLILFFIKYSHAYKCFCPFSQNTNRMYERQREIEREKVATFLRVHNSMLETGLNNVICSIIEGDKIK